MVSVTLPPAAGSVRTDTTRAAEPAATVATPAQPVAQPAAQPAGWSPAPASRPRPSVGERLLNDAGDSIGDSARRSYSLLPLSGTPYSSGMLVVNASAGLTEQLLTKENDADPVRRATGQVWSKVTTQGGLNVRSVGLDAGAYVGANSMISAYAIAPTNVRATDSGHVHMNQFDGVGTTIRDTATGQAQSLAVTFDPSLIKKRALVPGTEIGRTYSVSTSAGAGVGVNADAGVVRANAGASVGTSAGVTFSDFLEVMPPKADGHMRVFVSRARTLSDSVNARVGAEARIDTSAPSVVDRQLNRVAGVNASVGGSIGADRVTGLQGEFDLDNPQQLQAYLEFMGANPLELEKNSDAVIAKLRSVGVGDRYATEARTAQVNANLKFGRKDVLSFSSASRKTDGTIEVVDRDSAGHAVKTTNFSESEYNRHVGGIIPSWVGPTGNMNVRATEFVRPDGTKTTGAAMSMNKAFKEVDTGMMQRMKRLLPELGVQLTDAQAASNAAGGKGELDLEFALTPDSFAKLSTLPDGQQDDFVRGAFDRAFEKINGRPTPWNDTQPIASLYRGQPTTTRAAEFESTLRTVNLSFDHEDADRAISDYNRLTGGSWQKDLESYETRKDVAEELVKARGKKPSEWGHVLKAVGKANPADFLVIGLAAHSELAAPLVRLHGEANGVEVNAAPKLDARTASSTQVFTSLTDRWNR